MFEVEHLYYIKSFLWFRNHHQLQKVLPKTFPTLPEFLDKGFENITAPSCSVLIRCWLIFLWVSVCNDAGEVPWRALGQWPSHRSICSDSSKHLSPWDIINISKELVDWTKCADRNHCALIFLAEQRRGPWAILPKCLDEFIKLFVYRCKIIRGNHEISSLQKKIIWMHAMIDIPYVMCQWNYFCRVIESLFEEISQRQIEVRQKWN